MKRFCALAAGTMLLAAGLARGALQDDLLFSLPFDGSLTPAVAKGNPAVAGGAQDLSYVAGKEGKAAFFSKGTLVFQGPGNIDPAEGTLMFWIRPENWSSGDNRCHNFVTASFLYPLYLGKGWSYSIAPEYIYCSLGGFGATAEPGAGGAGASAGGVFKAGAWTHLAMTWSFSRKTVVLYVNGKEAGAGALNPSEKAKAWRMPANLQVVLGGSASGIVDAAWDEFRVYRRALAPAEIAAAAGIAVEQSKPKAIYDPAAHSDLPPTPGTAWARPLSGGPLKALIVLPESCLQEAIELWRRLDMQASIVALEDADLIRQRLASGLDVIILGSVSWKGLADDVRSGIIGKVTKEHVGLVAVSPRDVLSDLEALFQLPLAEKSSYLVDHLPLAELNTVFDLTRLRGSKIWLKGDAAARLVVLRYREDPPGLAALTPDTAGLVGADDTGYDYWQSLLCRAVVWAARREPPVEITAVTAGPDSWKVTIAGKAELPRTAQLFYRARNALGDVYLTGEPRVNLQGTTAEVSLPGAVLPPGTLVDLILKGPDAKVLAWHSAELSTPRSFSVASFASGKPYYAEGEPVDLTVSVSGAAGAGVCAVDCFLEDAWGRVVARDRKDISVNPGAAASASFRFAKLPLEPRTLVYRARAQVRLNDSLLDDTWIECPVPRKEWNDFYFVMWGSANNNYLNRRATALLRDRSGVNVVLESPWASGDFAAQMNMSSIAYLWHIGYDLMNDPKLCVTTPEYRGDMERKLRAATERIMRYRPLGYSLGDEDSFPRSSCATPSCLAGFQEYLRKRYGTIAALNDTWGTKYAGWTEVRTEDKNEFSKTDSVLYMETVFAETLGFGAQVIKRVDPLARVGMEGTWDVESHRGYDYWKISRNLDWIIGYAGSQNRHQRSFFGPATYGWWWNYEFNNPFYTRWHPWAMLANGAHGISWYSMFADGPYSALNGDLTPSREFAWAREEVASIINGTGLLLSRAQKQEQGVALHYSQASFHKNEAVANAQLNFATLLGDCGLPWRFVSYQELEQGGLKSGGFSVLILPGSVSMSEAEARAVREFVAGGGTVIADQVPAVCGWAGKTYPAGLLSDLFAALSKQEIAGVSVSAGTQGKGRVVLLPALYVDYIPRRNVSREKSDKLFMVDVAGRAGVTPAASVENADGTLSNGTLTAGFSAGRDRYAVVLRDYQVTDTADRRVQVKFPQDGQLYDVCAGKYLGAGRQCSVTLQTARGRVFASFPYRVIGLDVVVREPVRRGADLKLDVNLKTDGSVARDEIHVFRLAFTGPSGSEAIHFRKQLVAPGGKTAYILPVAWNEPTGRWRVTVTDVASGVSQTATWVVE